MERSLKMNYIERFPRRKQKQGYEKFIKTSNQLSRKFSYIRAFFFEKNIRVVMPNNAYLFEINNQKMIYRFRVITQIL
jgi:hypothetical protein